MNKNRIFMLIAVLAILLQACSGTAGQSVTPVPPTLPPTIMIVPSDTPLPTYTPEPTATATIQPTETPTEAPFPTPQFSAILLQPGETKSSSNITADAFFYFEGHQGDTIDVSVLGELGYYFSLRDDTNKGLTGCEQRSQKNCVLSGYQLPYTGIYYILVERPLADQYKHYFYCLEPLPPSRCFNGGTFTITLTTK